MLTTPRTFAEAVKHVSELAQAKLPEALQGHIQRATALVLHGHVFLEEDGRHARVRSSDGTSWYPVNGHCTCMDAPRVPEGNCKHRIALMIYRRAGDVLRSAAFPLPEGEGRVDSCQLTVDSTDNGQRSTDNPPPCPEALFSATFDGRIGGVGVRLTARGASFEAFAANVQAVRALLDAPLPLPAGEGTPHAASAPGPTPVCPTHGPMKPSSKAPGTFYCTKKLYDGSYCTSRYPEQ